MSKNTKKVSINTFEKVYKETRDPEVQIEWNGIELNITKTLSLTDMFDFVNTVVNSCFDDEDNYMPEARQYVIKMCLLEKYAGFTRSVNNENMYDMIYGTDAVEVVYPHINHTQFKEIVDAIEEKIEKRTSSQAEYIRHEFEKLFTAYENLENQMGDFFSSYNSEDIKSVIKAMSEGGLDEEKLVKAVRETNKED